MTSWFKGEATPGDVALRPSVAQLVNHELSGVPSFSKMLGLTHQPLTFLIGISGIESISLST